MHLLCNAKAFYESIANAYDKEMFRKKYGSPARFEHGIYVSLPNAKTLTQNSAIWGDWSLVAGYLHCSKETIYYILLKAEEFQDIWLHKKDGRWEFQSLSQLNKEKTSNFIPRYREFLQAMINEEYGEWVAIKWYQKEEEEIRNESSKIRNRECARG